MQNGQQSAASQQNWKPDFELAHECQAVHQQLASACAAWTTRVPAAVSTVLALDLLLQGPSFDLQAASEIVLSDVGATLQVLRLAGCDKDSPESAARIEDCLAGLDADVWFAAIAAQTISRTAHAAQLNAVWQHSRLVAQYAAVIAESYDGIAPATAYMVGLLHEIETLSILLHEETGSIEPDDHLLLEQVVPAPVLAALASAKERETHSPWRYILSSAHALAAAVPQFARPASRGVN